MKYLTVPPRVSTAVLAIAVAAVMTVSFHCIDQPLEPKAPSWQTQITLKMLTRTYSFDDVVRKDTKFDTTSGVILYKPITDVIGYRQGIPASVFQMPSPRGNTIQQEIGVVPVTVQAIPPVDVSPSDLGLTAGTIPPFTPDPPATAMRLVFGDSSVYKYLIFESGQMTLTITNNFPFAIQIVGNTVQLINKNDTTETVATFTFAGQIAGNGGSATSTVAQLANKKMDAGLVMKATIQVVGWAGTTIQSTDKLTAQLQMSNATVKSALALTDQFDGTNVIAVPDSAVLLDDSIKVKFAKFESGQMKVRIVNHVPLKLTVQFKIDELIDNATGKPYALPGTDPNTGTTTIDPRDSLVTILDMSKMTFVSRLRNPSSDTLVTQDLHFSLGIKTLSASTNYELVNKTDYVITDVQPVGSFVLQEVEGKVPPTEIAINQQLDAGIGDIGNKLNLTAFNSNIKLSTNVLSTGLFPTNLVMRVYALDSKGNPGRSVLVRNASDDPNYHRIVPGQQDVIDMDSSDVNYLMNSFTATLGELPAKFQLTGYALVSPPDVYTSTSPDFGVGIGGVKQQDSIFVSLDYALPVALGIQNGSLKDTSSFTENNIDTAQINLIESGKIFFNIKNSFPLRLNLAMKLLRADPLDSSKADATAPPVLTIPQDPNDPATYPPISIASDTSAARSGVASFTFLNLKPEEAAKLVNASFAAVDLQFNTGANLGNVRTIKRTDHVDIEVFANIIFNVDFDRLK